MKVNESGFSLIELLVVMVIVGIIVGFAVLRYQGVATNTMDAVQKQRLMQYADAQNKYKTVKGKRRYATLTELKQEGLLNETVIKFDSDGNQVAINNWTLIPGTETTAYLRDHFFIKLQKNGTTAASTTPTYCISEDGVLRRSPASDATACSNTSPVVEN